MIAMIDIINKLRKVCEANLENGRLEISGGDYDIYTDPAFTSEGLEITVNAFGGDQRVVLTWEEIDFIKKALAPTKG